MANEEHLNILKQGVEAWKQWRRERPEIRPDLSGANLRRANLFEADLSKANLRQANLRGAYLRWANLFEANLIEADLSGAYLGRANLSAADLSGANLRRANLFKADLSMADLSMADLRRAELIGANLIEADLTMANLSRSKMNRTTLANVDLSVVKGLDTVIHEGPSSIGIDTIYRSGGSIPEVFLRGAGVLEDFVTYMGSLVGKHVQFYSCFISYSHKDEEFAKRLHSRMRDEHLRVWFAPEDIRAGKKIHEQIEEAIRHHDKLIIVLSEASMESEWVQTEIYHARQREIKEGRQILFPIRLVDFEEIRQWKSFDADSGRDMAREIREYFIPDFSNWKNPDAFDKAFADLLRDLEEET